MKVIILFLAAIPFFLGCNTQNRTSPSNSDSSTVAKETKPLQHETLPFKADVPDAAMQIKLALLAAPPEKRDSCTVYGYDASNQLVIIKKGTNELICLADNPKEPNFSVACYNKNLEPLMESGRLLRKQGFKGQQIFDERAKEVKAGSLKMPEGPTTLYVYSADDKDVNRKTGEVKKGYLRYVVYIPFATVASTGLPLKPSAPGMPWIMDPGTFGAHIMINP
jgi:hypothetical protein